MPLALLLDKWGFALRSEEFWTAERCLGSVLLLSQA